MRATTRTKTVESRYAYGTFYFHLRVAQKPDETDLAARQSIYDMMGGIEQTAKRLCRFMDHLGTNFISSSQNVLGSYRS